MPTPCLHQTASDPLEDRKRTKSQKGCWLCRAAGFRAEALKLWQSKAATASVFGDWLKKEGDTSEDSVRFDKTEMDAGRALFGGLGENSDAIKGVASTPIDPGFNDQISPYVPTVATDNTAVWRVRFIVEKGQNGESYHAIAAAVCFQSTRRNLS